MRVGGGGVEPFYIRGTQPFLFVPNTSKLLVISIGYRAVPGPGFALLRRMRIASFLQSALLFVMTVTGLSIGSEAAWAVEYDSSHQGYLTSVKDERYELSQEIVIVAPPESKEPKLSEQIFTEKLTTDFQEKYENEFGRTEAQQIQVTPSRFFDKEMKPGEYGTEEEYVAKQQKFGNYMTKRLAEYHIDNYMRNTPSTRGVYEAKEKLGNMSIETKKGYKTKFKYSISSNQLEMNVENPYKIETRLILYKIQNLGSKDQATLSSLGYNVTKTIKFVTDYATEDSKFSVSGVKRLKGNWSTSLTASKSYIEDKIILGLAWKD